MDIQKTRKALRITSALIFFYAVFSLLSALPFANGLFRLFADFMIWPLDGAQSLDAKEVRLLLAIGGGGFFALGWLVWLLSGDVLEAAPEAIVSLVKQACWAWFLTDSVASVAAGVPLNIAGNLIYLVALLAPLHTLKR